MTRDNSPDTSDEEEEEVSTKQDTTLSTKEEDGFDSDASNEEHKSKTVREHYKSISEDKTNSFTHSLTGFNTKSKSTALYYIFVFEFCKDRRGQREMDSTSRHARFDIRGNRGEGFGLRLCTHVSFSRRKT
jgi:hypothetical protein